MQSGGQAAGIQLQVGLDLAFFRSQLVGLQAVTTGTKLSFGVTFKRLDIQNELNALATNIKKRNYFLEVKTNLANEIELAKQLATALDKLGRSQQTAKTGVGQRLGVGAIGRAPKDKGLGYKDVQKLYKASADAGLLAFDKEIARTKVSMVAAMDAIGVDAIAGLLNGLSSQDARLRAAAESIGENLIKTTKTSLGIASPSKKFEEIGKNVGKGFEKGALSSMDNAFDAMENKMRQRGKILDTVARGIFRMLGMDPAAMLQQARDQRATPARTPIAGLLPSSTARGAREEIVRQLGEAGRGQGGGLPVAQGPGRLALSNEALGRRISVILQEYFKVAEVQVRESLNPQELKQSLNVFSYIAQSLRDAESRTKQAQVAESVDSLMQAIDNAIKVARARVRISSVQVSELGPRAQAALPAGRVAGFLPGRPSQASVLELNNILAGAIREYFAAVAREIKPSTATRGRPLLGPGSTVAGLLPPAGGTTPVGQMRFNSVSTGAFVGQPQFMRAPGIPSPAGGGGAGGSVPRPPSGGGGMGGMSNFGNALGSVNLPGAGVVREIGSEFAMAAKQVLLFGTAYKALAFLTSFPSQVGEAVGALQSFNNTLKAISPSAEEARASNQFILDIVDRYNVPLQSARDGFTKLYASMAPAGFKGDEIRALFTGVSQAAATFGMSADKVDRVNYAFAQMASKGQVMSEELKGQLGDVLPGAMGIFAEAAGFKGKDAIEKFSKALEDGAYKGDAMRGLLKNVTTVLTKEFGPGAEGAARTFQGVINRMQNSTKLLYEAFEPVAVGFLNSVVVPLTSGIKTVADGFNSFFTGVNAKTSGGFAIAQELEKLRPTFDGLRENAKQLIQVFGQFAQIALGVGKVLLQIASNPFVGFMAKIYAIIVPLNMALGVMRGLWALNSLQLLIFNARIAAGTTTLTAFRGMMAATGATATTTAAAIRAGFASTGVGLVLVGIGLLIERFLSMNQALADTKTKALGAADAIRSMSQTEARQAENQATRDVKILQSLQQKKNEGKAIVAITKEEQSALERAGVRTGKMVVPGQMAKKGSLPELLNYGQQSVDVTQIQGALSAREGIAATAKRQIEDLRFQERQTQQAANIAPLPPGTGDGTKPVKEKSLESYHSLQDQLAKNFTQDQLDRMEKEYQAKVDRINAEFNLREARANSYQKEAIRFEKQMSDIELKRQKALLDASAEVIKAQGSVAGGAGGQSTTGATGLLQGSTGISSGAHFDVRRQDGSYISPEQAKALFDPSVRRQLAMTSAYGPRRAPVPGASTFHKGVDLAGPANTPLNLAPGFAMTGSGEKGGLGYAASVRGPSGEMYDVGHLQRPKAGMATPRKVTGDEKRDVIADQKAQLAIAQKSLAVQIAEAQAVRDAAVAWAEYTTSIAPIEEQKLQNSILAKKNDLVKLGMPDDVIEREMKHFETQQKTALAVEVVEKMLADKKISAEAATAKIAELNKRMADYNKLLGDNIELQRQQKFDANLKQLKDQIEALRIVGDEERRLFELRKEYRDDKKAQEIFDLEKIKKNIEDTRALIDGFVTQTSSDYKGFLKAVISGEDAVDALKQFQEGLKDRVLTIFLDFAMAPVEKFMKESLEGLFLPKAKKEAGRLPEATSKDPVEATNSNTNATNTNTTELKNLTSAIQGMGAGTNAAPSVQGPTAGNAFYDGSALPSIAPGFDAGSVFGNPEALTGAFADIQSSISTSMEGITSSFQMGADSLANTLPSWSDSLTTALPAALTTSTEKTEGEIPNFQKSLGKVAAGIGIAAGAIMGIAAGISQIKEGGTSNVLGGIGSILMSIGGGIGGFAKLAGANGGVADGGWKPFPIRAFANGGMVSGPTLGLVGEGKYNEAIVPLPDGRSIPVQFNQQPSLRESMAGSSNNTTSPSILSMTFESTSINGVEYVSRDQLEAAMAETRRNATRDGASRGMTMTLDRIQNSSSTRRRIGV